MKSFTVCDHLPTPTAYLPTARQTISSSLGYPMFLTIGPWRWTKRSAGVSLASSGGVSPPEPAEKPAEDATLTRPQEPCATLSRALTIGLSLALLSLTATVRG